LILINSSFEANVPIIRESVEKLCFKFCDIRMVLGSHAHDDHQEGDALVKVPCGDTHGAAAARDNAAYTS
jgi:metallo-beta-lactamase class B